jgi:hypothetical protein
VATTGHQVQITASRNAPDQWLRLREGWPLLLYFGAILISFCRTQLFFCFDEYIALWRETQSPSWWRFIFQPHNEHFIPLFHAFWVLEASVFGENHVWYVLTNIALLSLAGFLWQSWLRSIGLPPALAVITVLVGVTCLSQADNVMVGWQAVILLSSIALIGTLMAYSKLRLGYVALFSCCSALTFSSAYALPAVIAAYLLYDYWIVRERRLVLAAAGLLTIFVLLITFSAISGALISEHLSSSIWKGATVFQKIAHLVWIGWYTVGTAFYGPVSHLLKGRVPDGPSDIMTMLSLAFMAIVVHLSWKSLHRGLVLKLLALQLVMFAFIGPFRNSPPHMGFAARYYTFGLIPWLSAAAIGFWDGVRRYRVSEAWRKFVLVLLILLSARNMRCALIQDWLPVQWGRAARAEYYLTKEWLRQHKNQPVGNFLFGQSAAQGLDLSMLIPIIRRLDSSFVTVPLSMKNSLYLENTVPTRGWGLIVDGQPATQTFRVSRSAIAQKVELLVSQYQGFEGAVRISIVDDAGRFLWSVAIPSDLWPMNAWLGVPVSGQVRLESQREYSIQVESTARSLAAPTVWMNDHPDDPYPLIGTTRTTFEDFIEVIGTTRTPDDFIGVIGTTRTPDGVTGVLCFRLAMMEP